MSQLAVETTAYALAVIAAIRSTWSPCGLSMLSTLTPFGERSRGHRYGATVAWFVVGSLVGGAVLGGVMAAAAGGVGRWSLNGAATAIVVATTAAIAVVSDLDLAGWHLPRVPRQVNETWTGRYRGWVYAAGFGAQIGVGFVTYVMTAAVYLIIVLAAMTGAPFVALGVGLCFGGVRGLAVLLGAPCSTPEALRRLHRWFEGAERPVRYAVIAAQIDVLALALRPEAFAVLATVELVAVGIGLGARARFGQPRRVARGTM